MKCVVFKYVCWQATIVRHLAEECTSPRWAWHNATLFQWVFTGKWSNLNIVYKYADYWQFRVGQWGFLKLMTDSVYAGDLQACHFIIQALWQTQEVSIIPQSLFNRCMILGISWYIMTLANLNMKEDSSFEHEVIQLRNLTFVCRQSCVWNVAEMPIKMYKISSYTQIWWFHHLQLVSQDIGPDEIAHLQLCLQPSEFPR